MKKSDELAKYSDLFKVANDFRGLREKPLIDYHSKENEDSDDIHVNKKQDEDGNTVKESLDDKSEGRTKNNCEDECKKSSFCTLKRCELIRITKVVRGSNSFMD